MNILYADTPSKICLLACNLLKFTYDLASTIPVNPSSEHPPHPTADTGKIWTWEKEETLKVCYIKFKERFLSSTLHHNPPQQLVYASDNSLAASSIGR
jgi:hypothetical protein